MLGNALRSHFAEYGIVEPQGQGGLARLVACALDAPDTALPQAAHESMAMLAAHVRETDAKMGSGDRALNTRPTNPYLHRVRSQQLAENIAEERKDAVGEIALRRLSRSTVLMRERRVAPGFQALASNQGTDSER